MGMLSDLFGWFVPRFPELLFLFFAYIWWQSTGLDGAVTPAAVFSSAFLITWAILRMTRILSDPERGGS